MSSSPPSPSPSASPSPSLYTRTATALSSLLDPWLFMALSLSYVPRAMHTVLTQPQSPHSPISPTSPSSSPWSRFSDTWFALFWADAGRRMRESADAKVLPLLSGGVSGVVLELGAGTGVWVDVWAGLRGRVERVYGVEPSAGSPQQHGGGGAALRRAVRRAGIEDLYEIVPVGIEDLGGDEEEKEKKGEKKEKREKEKKWDGRIEQGSVDCVVSILTLCSVPDPEARVRELYGYLKPGGRFYVYEHVRSEHSWYMRLYQRFLNIFWPHLVGNCCLCRRTEKILRDAGPWSRIEVGQPPAEQWHHCLPHILGVFTK
ncbi:S-adenosyl-L-methionine-dependent methyltransferase [Biscogniauxia sp. FL1348]|nr:S-adenosyl-L-methionine-dependent methyltransferase [Biscogniauxia sp. FL1348]